MGLVGLHGDPGRIVFFAQMANRQPLQAPAVIGHQPRRFFIGEMAVRSPDAILQHFGIRAVAQHVFIIVGLQQRRVQGGE